MSKDKAISKNINDEISSKSATTCMQIKAVCALTSSVCFLMGIRNVRKPLKYCDFPAENPLSAVKLGRKALANSLAISISGFTFFVVMISAILDVNTPREFGKKMRRTFGDRYKISKTESSETYNSFSDLIEAYSDSKTKK